MPTSLSRLPALAFGLAVVVAACGGSAGASATPSSVTPSSAASDAASPSPSSAASTSAASASSSSAPAESASAASAACTSPATATIAETEGPYYKAGAPESADLVTAGMAGTQLTLTGWVVDTTCAPLANAKVEIWQADSAGQYDNTGFTLRGWVTTDASGHFSIHTIVPGEYPGRTEHIHVKVTPAGGSTLTTQVYFPGTTANDSDGIYDPSLLLAIAKAGDSLIGTYTFVIGA
jgi:protocatechuate 3,4-dioxygenase beta subunit